jgi:hypothetical protein
MLEHILVNISKCASGIVFANASKSQYSGFELTFGRVTRTCKADYIQGSFFSNHGDLPQAPSTDRKPDLPSFGLPWRFCIQPVVTLLDD